MDIFKDDFEPSGVVLLSNNGEGNKGIPIRCDHLVMILCVNGEGHRRINHHRFQMTKQSAHVILPGQIHSFSNTTNDFDIFILLIEPSFFSQLNIPKTVVDELLKIDTQCHPKMNLDKAEFTEWLNTFRQLDHEIRLNKKYQHEIVASYILTLMYKIKRKLHHETDSHEKLDRRSIILNDFKSLIETQFHEKKAVSEYADMMNISSKHLSETVKEKTNHTALYFIHERIIHEAEYLLVYSNRSVKEIAFSLDFDTPSHFTRFFKHKKGSTPLAYRSTHQL